MNRTTGGPPDHLKETQTAVVWSCLPFIRSGQNHLARHSGRGKKTRQTQEEVGRRHQGMDRPGVCQVPEGNGEQGKIEKTGCKIICGAPTTLAVRGLMMMMVMWFMSLSLSPGSLSCALKLLLITYQIIGYQSSGRVCHKALCMCWSTWAAVTRYVALFGVVSL